MARSRAGLGILVEIIGDEKSLLRANTSAVASNTKLNASLRQVGVVTQETASLQVAAKAKVIEADRAQVAALEKYSAAVAGNAKLSEAANIELAASQAKLNRELGVSSVAIGRTSTAAKTGEADLNKLVRGGLAGSGAFSALGRSLAFASSGFIAFAAGATIIAKSISAARALGVAQAQVNRQLQTSGKTFAQYGARIDEATTKLSHIAGFTRIDLLSSFGFAVRATGNVSSSLRLMSIAADVARGRGLNLQSSMIALTKAVGGSSTALRRLGIIVPKTAKGWDAINFVAAKFAGQARAGTTASQRFSATLVTTEEVIGSALLPTVNKLLTSFGNWLQKMNETGRLQRDVTSVTHAMGAVFKQLGSIIGDVDAVTGSFKKTVELLVGLKLASIISGWSLAFKGLIGVGGGAAAAGEGIAGADVAATGLLARLTALGELAPIAIPVTLLLTDKKVTSGLSRQIGDLRTPNDRNVIDFLKTGASVAAHIFQRAGFAPPSNIRGQGAQTPGVAVNQQFLRSFMQQLFGAITPARPSGGAAGPFGTAKPMTQYFKSFALTFKEQMTQVQASLTRGNDDDVRAAKQVVAHIKSLIDQGRIRGPALVQALGLELSALQTIWGAEDAIAQKRAAAAQKAKAKALAAFANLVDPLGVEVELLRAEAGGRSTLPALKKLLASARKALAQAKGLAEQQQALQQIVTIQGQIKSLSTQATVTFVASLKLQLALAKDQALGRNDTKDLLKLRHAILKFIHAHRHNTAALIDAYGQLAAVNAQLASSASSALGLFRTASTKLLTEGLGLTPDQRRRLRARLSQMGPGGTIPGTGTGAAGYAINPDTGRPVVINMDGKKVGEIITRHQQRHRRRNSHQRRGPNAGH